MARVVVSEFLPLDGVFEDPGGAVAKYVVSASLENPAWNNSTVLSGSPAQSVASLRERLTGDILVAGSAGWSARCWKPTSSTSCG